MTMAPAALPRKILVVDDQPAIRSGLKKLLENAGFQVVVAGSFAGARVALSKVAPDLLISDVRLGDYNGLQLLAGTLRAIPAIMITGFPDQVLAAEARRFGAEFLIKPFESATLIALVKRKLEAPAEEPANDHGNDDGNASR
jgi:DNA-binding NtrC family response regulator